MRKIICFLGFHSWLEWRNYHAIGEPDRWLQFDFKKRVCGECAKEDWEFIK